MNPMKSGKFIYQCLMCDKEFEWGPHIHDGTYISGYEIWVCTTCYDSNWDGWAPGDHEIILLAHLKKEGLPVPERNKSGWLPREVPESEPGQSPQ